MDIAVVGSNMVDLISYIDRMPTEGRPLRLRTSDWDVAAREPTKPWPPPDWAPTSSW